MKPAIAREALTTLAFGYLQPERPLQIASTPEPEMFDEIKHQSLFIQGLVCTIWQSHL